MNKYLTRFYGCLLVAMTLLFSGIAVAKKSYNSRTSYTKTRYIKKAPYSGFGKKSSTNGMIKTKPVKGYFKPSNGYKFVNPYARSK